MLSLSGFAFDQGWGSSLPMIIPTVSSHRRRSAERRTAGIAGVALWCGLSLTACQDLREDFDRQLAQAKPTAIATSAPVRPIEEPIPEAPGPGALPAPEIYYGTGIPPIAQLAADTGQPINVTEGGDVVLNFVNAPVREFVDAVLGTTLDVGYLIDPRVDGTITVRSPQPVPRETVIGVVEDVLAMNGAALVKEGAIYKIVPIEEANPKPTILRQEGRQVAFDRGFSLNIIPLRYASAEELREVVEPFVPSGRALRVDPLRNLFVFAGTSSEAADFADLVSIFDVDWVASKSFGLFPLTYADPNSMASELERVFSQGAQGEGPGTIDVIPIERLNAVLVITSQGAYLKDVRAWVERLDRGVEAEQRQLYVYYVQNGRASELADLLGKAFDIDVSQSAREAISPDLAPGLDATEMNRPAASLYNSDDLGSPASPAGDVVTPSRPALPPRLESVEALPGFGAPSDIEDEPAGASRLRIVADQRNNALLIHATSAEYGIILAALKKLDIVPLQVMIEATIAEVTLNDALKYGVEWFFNFGNSNLIFSTREISTSDPAPSQLLGVFPSFSYILAASNTKVILSALSQITDVKVISSPQLMVLDNEPARLQVGDQVPVAVRSSISTETTTEAPIVAEIEYRDTGVILDMVPRVNASGLVVLDIVQEVSDVAQTVVASTTTTVVQATTPTISQRRIATTVAVNSGETVALGGLIRDGNSKSVTGVPLLSDIPILGNLFKTTTDTTRRTELLVLLTPRVVHDRNDARTVTDDLRQRMRRLAPMPPLTQ